MQDWKFVTRSRLQAAGVMAAVAFVVGLSAPSGGVVDSPSTSDRFDVAATPGTGTVPAASAGGGLNVLAGADIPANPIAPAPPTAQELHPVPVTGQQQEFTPTEEQLANTKAIVDAGKAMGLPPRAWTIAVATSLQESNLRNLGNLGTRNDHDSLGLFQQRPSSGWGSPAQIQDPTYSATAFYKGLVRVPNWDSLPLTVAAQKVQVSAYPDHYAKHEAQAGDMIEALYGEGPYANLAVGLR